MESAGTDTATETNQETVKTYTQEEFDNHMAGLKNSLTRKFEKQFSELGDIEELKALKASAEKQKQEEAIKAGQFEKILQDLASKKDEEIASKNRIIEEYTVTTPLLNAAAKYKAVNPEQVVQLIRNQVRLGETGTAEVVDANGNVRYDDSGSALTVDHMVKEWLDSNPHFVAASRDTTASKTSATAPMDANNIDLATIDLTRPENRELYKQALQKGLI